MENLSSVRDIGIVYLQAHFESNLNHYKNQKNHIPHTEKESKNTSKLHYERKDIVIPTSSNFILGIKLQNIGTTEK